MKLSLYAVEVDIFLSTDLQGYLKLSELFSVLMNETGLQIE